MAHALFSKKFISDRTVDQGLIFQEHAEVLENENFIENNSLLKRHF